MKKTDIELNDLFSRGVSEFIDPEGKFREKIEKKLQGKYSKDIVIKFGVDPTRPDIHLGHAVILRKLRKFQDIGCKVIFLVGDFTAHIGDPTGKSSVRPELEQKEIEANMKTYIEQVGKILLIEPEVFSWIRNSDWFVSINDIVSPDGNNIMDKTKHWVDTRMQKGVINNHSLINFLWTLRHITHSRLIERDMFQERLKRGEELYMHEMMYPVLQGIDSFVLSKIYGSCDMEIGGSDQTFNMLLGRDVMKFNKVEQQAVMALKIIEGTDGKEKMSKSLGNYISIIDAPADMFGKVMSIPDKSLANYFELATFEPISEIEKIKKSLEGGKVNPKDIKMKLAKEIVAIYHGEKEAKSAEENFINVFQKKEIPENIPEIRAKKGEALSDLLVKNKILKSKSEFTRKIEEGAVHDLDSQKTINDMHFKIEKEIKIRIGKKTFLKITLY
jgi:tyrosyl-tRNA synthetase